MATTVPIIAVTGKEVTIQNTQYTSLSDAITVAKNTANAATKQKLFEDIGEYIQGQKDTLRKAGHELYEAVQSDNVMKQVVQTAVTDEDDAGNSLWVAMRKAHAGYVEYIAKKTNLENALAKTWDEDTKDSFMTFLGDASTSKMKNIASIIRANSGVAWRDLQPLLRDTIYDRVTGSSQGVSKKVEISVDDVKKAYAKIKEKQKGRPISFYRRLGFSINDEGWPMEAALTPADIQGPRVEEVDDDDGEEVQPRQLLITAPPDKSIAEQESGHLYLSDDEGEEMPENSGLNVSRPEVIKDSADTSTTTTAVAGSKRRADDISTDDNDDAAVAADEGQRRSKRLQVAAPDDSTVVNDDGDEMDVDDDTTAVQTPAADEVAGDDDAGDDDVDTTKLKCKCSSKVPAEFKSSANTKIPHKDSTAQHALARRYVKIIDNGNSICYKHSHATAGNVGFQIKRKKFEDLVELLRQYVIHLDAGTLAAHKTTRGLFRKSHRQVLPEDGLGPYRFAHGDFLFVLTPEQQAELQESENIDMEVWNKVGSINLSCFAWMKNFTIGHMKEDGIASTEEDDVTIYDIVIQELDMYRYHQRLVNGKSNMGWLRNMIHSLAQQAMRMSLRYYLLYCALRPDQCHRLITYPYYAKYQTKDDGASTAFRHIDIAIEAAVTRGRGINEIQGTLSLDDERSDDCTIILPGMHTRMAEWHDRVKDRPAYSADPYSFVSRISDALFNADDKKHFNTDWTPAPCEALDVRITDSRIPHGAQGAQGTRRTLLPWFCGVDAEGNLMIPEGGTADELAAAHRDLGPGKNTPSGLANRYSAIPYPFPAAVHLFNNNLISQSLVGRVRLDSVPLNLYKKRFFTDTEFRFGEVAQNEADLAGGIALAWEEVKKIEQEVFGTKSYFYRVKHGLSVEWDSIQDASSNDADFAKEVPHGGTLQIGDGQEVMVGSDVLRGEDNSGSDEEEAVQRAIEESYGDLNIRKSTTATTDARRPAGGRHVYSKRTAASSAAASTTPVPTTPASTPATVDAPATAPRRSLRVAASEAASRRAQDESYDDYEDAGS